MDKYETRRLRLLEIRDSLCEGKGAEIARRIDRTPSYVTRMLWPEGKKGRKRIGDDMVDIIEEAFNLHSGWLDKKQPINTEPSKTSTTGSIGTAVGANANIEDKKTKHLTTKREKTIQEINDLMKDVEEDDLEKAKTVIEALAYHAVAKKEKNQREIMSVR